MTPEDIDTIFTYHNPKDNDPLRFEMIRNAAKELGKMIIKHGGKERDVEISILQLRNCVHFAIASIVVPHLSDEIQ